MMNNHFGGQLVIEATDELNMKKEIKNAKQEISEQLTKKLMTEPELFDQKYDAQRNLHMVVNMYIFTKHELDVLIAQVREETVQQVKKQNESVIIRPKF